MRAYRGVVAASFVALVAVTVPAVGDDGRTAGFDYPAIWKGLYGGVNVGWGSGGDASGAVGGGQVGYNWQSHRFVYGVEGDISASDIGASESIFGFDKVSVSVDWIATIRGRAGYLLQPNLLVYGTAGVGLVNWDARESVFGMTVLHTSGTETQFVFGVGVESKITQTMSARLEYLEFSESDRIGNFGIVRAGLNFKFGP